jgi:hypothetical protein
MDIAVETTAGERRFTITSLAAQEEFSFPVDAQPIGVKLDPDSWVLKRVVPHSDLADTTEPASVQVESFYPNPVTTSATLRLRVPHLGPLTTLNGETTPQAVKIELFDVRGRRVGPSRSLTLGPGVFDLPFDLRDGDGRRLRGGTYLLHVTTPSGSDTRRVVVLP